MKIRRYLSKIAAFSMTLCMMAAGTTVYADSRINLSAVPNNSENYVALNWNAPDSTNRYSYMIYSKEEHEEQYQTIPAKADIKVLNIYPGTGRNLKKFMETNGYGKGLMSVDEVNIDTFNSNPNKYLKDSNGNWKYDVVYQGAWDTNNGKNLNQAAIIAVEQYIKSGRGYLSGHDTIGYTWGNSGLSALRNYFNIKVCKWGGSGACDTGYNYNTCGYVSNSTIIKKKGLLTNYPWEIGDVGTTLSIPTTHSTSNFALGDIWMVFPNTVWSSGDTNRLSDELKRQSNFYLTTWNNCAMIQTGHSNGAATADEQKVLANTIFYLAQITESTSWDDHKGQDLAAPAAPSISGVTFDSLNNKMTVNYMPSIDKGSTYNYYIEATNLYTKEKINSETKEATVTSGIKGYSIVVDNNPDTVPSGNVTTTETSYSVSLSGMESKDIYVHVAAVDNRDNVSEVSHYKYGVPVLTVTPNTTQPAAAVTINAGAVSSNANVEKIQTPDGNWIDGNTASYVVRENGVYTFKAMDSNGVTAAKDIVISNIDKNAAPDLTLTPNTTEPAYEVTINAIGSSSTSTVEKIQTPDGNWVLGDTADYTVDENGTYTFKVSDNYGTVSTKSIIISNIQDTKVILNIEPRKDNLNLGEVFEAYLTMDNIQQIAAEDVRIKYDSSKLQFMGMVEVPGIKVVKDEQNNDELRVILASQGVENVVFMKKNLLKLNFKAIAEGEALIDVTKGRISDGFVMEKDLRRKECGQAIVTISSFKDVNLDGDFSLLDLSIDGRYYGNNPADYPQYNTDIVLNGAIDDDDLIKIGEYMLENSNYDFNN